MYTYTYIRISKSIIIDKEIDDIESQVIDFGTLVFGTSLNRMSYYIILFYSTMCIYEYISIVSFISFLFNRDHRLQYIDSYFPSLRVFNLIRCTLWNHQKSIFETIFLHNGQSWTKHSSLSKNVENVCKICACVYVFIWECVCVCVCTS